MVEISTGITLEISALKGIYPHFPQRKAQICGYLPVVYVVEISKVLPAEISVERVQIFNFHWKKKSCQNLDLRLISTQKKYFEFRSAQFCNSSSPVQ